MTVKNTRGILIAIVALAVALRIGAVFFIGNTVVDLPGTADQISYHTLALRVLAGHGFTFGKDWWPATAAGAPTAHWSYLYTAYLIAVYAVFGPHPLAARLIQAGLVGIVQPLLAYWIGKRVFSREAGLVAAFLTAIYAYFVYYAATLMTESFYITAIMAGLAVAFSLADQVRAGETQRRSLLALGIGLGAALGAAVLLRQLFLLFVPFLFLWLLLAGRKMLLPIGVAAAVIAALILPLTAFNYARFHRFVLLNTNAGFAFFWGNHPIYGTHFVSILPSAEYSRLIPEELKSLDEAALDQALLRRGIGFILQDPGRYALLSLSRIGPYFKFWPSSDSTTISNLSRVLSFGIFWPFMALGLGLAAYRRKWRFTLRPPDPLLLLYLFVVIYSLIHILTWTLIRYRLPVDAVLVVFAGLAFVELAARVPALRRWIGQEAAAEA